MSSSIERLQELKELISKYRIAYYEQDETLVSDAEYDALERELKALEAQHPEQLAEARDVLAVEPVQRLGIDGDIGGTRDADQLAAHACRIGQRPHQVEDRAAAQCLADRHDAAHWTAKPTFVCVIVAICNTERDDTSFTCLRDTDDLLVVNWCHRNVSLNAMRPHLCFG